MRTAFLDYKTVDPGDLDLSPLKKIASNLVLYDKTATDEINERIQDSKIIIINKIKLDATTLNQARKTELICLVATGTDNVDLVAANKQGITEVVQTVHFQHPKMHGRNVEYDYLNNILQHLESQLVKEKIKIKIHLSAEVFYLPNLVDLIDNPFILIGENKYMLIEFANNIYPLNFEREFYNLQLNNVSPIVAHPERYRFVQNDINPLICFYFWQPVYYFLDAEEQSFPGKSKEM